MPHKRQECVGDMSKDGSPLYKTYVDVPDVPVNAVPFVTSNGLSMIFDFLGDLFDH